MVLGNIILQSKNKTTVRSIDSTVELSGKAGIKGFSSSGGLTITTQTDINFKSSQSVNTEASGSLNIKVNGSIYHTADGASHVKSSRHTVTAKICFDGTVNSGPVICPSVSQGAPDDSAQKAGAAQSATELWKTTLVDHMIIPTAEPFIRPAHNGPRNKNWVALNENVGSGSDISDETSAVHKGKEY